MIINPPSHRILLGSVNPCYPCFGIIHLCALASPNWMRMAGKSGPNSGGRGNLIPNNSFLKTCTTTDRRKPRHRERVLEHSIRTDEAN